MRRGLRIFIWVLALLATVALSFALYLVAEFSRPVASAYANRLPFNTEVWKRPPPGNDPAWPIRLRMVDDLLARTELVEMRREALVGLLGPPDNTPYFAAPGRMV